MQHTILMRPVCPVIAVVLVLHVEQVAVTHQPLFSTTNMHVKQMHVFDFASISCRESSLSLKLLSCTLAWPGKYIAIKLIYDEDHSSSVSLRSFVLSYIICKLGIKGSFYFLSVWIFTHMLDMKSPLNSSVFTPPPSPGQGYTLMSKEGG